MRSLQYVRLFGSLFSSKGPIRTADIEKMGLLAVKIAQMYAIRSDLLGVEKCKKLQKLYEDVTPLSWSDFEALLTKKASASFWEEIEGIDEAPLASASLGQVHVGRLKNGREVVIKVVRLATAEDFKKDLEAVRWLAKCALFFYPKLERLADPLGTLDTIERLTITEIDLRNEFSGTQQLRAIREQGLSEGLEHLQRLDFPEIYQELSNESVLVVERLQESSVRKQMEEESFQYDDVLMLFRIHGYFLFLQGRFHGDLHPGNVHGNANAFRMIDNANVEEVDPEFTRGLLEFLRFLGRSKFREAAQKLVSLSLEPPEDTEVFEQAFINLYADFEGKTVGEVSLTNQMMRTVKLAVLSGMEFPAGAFPVIKSLMYLDGIALSCAPGSNLLEDVAEFTG